ncbi:MAG: hypothetical protein KAQ87_02400 [Candidatus Pacebacteria bacterium]|nr:hypothetical protein [Candidatus Paceibacterota bacterium]
MEESKQNKIVLLRQMIENAERNITAAKQILAQLDDGSKKSSKNPEISQLIEGTFDGEKMISLDGKSYPVPANYASKSKLVEGDLLKLSITEGGLFLYKQISPIERRQIIGVVLKDENDKYYVLSEGKKYKVLLASLTYFKAKKGDEVTLVVPKEKISEWAAIEGVTDNAENNSDDLDLKINNLEDGIEENNKIEKQESMEDEWMPDIEEMKKEASFDEGGDKEISDDLRV